MPRESNFFEEAMTLCSNDNRFVSYVANAIYKTMLYENQYRKLSPKDGFNIHYFFKTVISVWYSDSTLDVSRQNIQFSDDVQMINGINWPCMETCSNPMVNRFIDQVKCDSNSNGDSFDVTYAVEILKSLIEKDCRILDEFSEELNESQFDYWLTGFDKI